jgi:hypothetical protein
MARLRLNGNPIMAKHDPSVFKGLKLLADTSILAILLAAMFLAMVSTPAHGQDLEVYRENFNDTRAEKVWELEKGWSVNNAMLIGRCDPNAKRSTWARYTKRRWGDGRFTLKFKLRRLRGAMHANIHVLHPDRYAIGFNYRRGNLLSVYLFRGAGDIHPHPRSTTIKGYNPKQEYQVEIITEGRNIRVSLEGKPVFQPYEASEPLPIGTVCFEALIDSNVWVDDVEIIGRPRVQQLPDLSIASAKEWRFEENNEVLVLVVDVANRGKAWAPETKVFARDPDHDWQSPMRPVRALGPGQTQDVEIRLRIPDKQRDITHVFLVEVDPNNEIKEPDEDNNTARTPGIYAPPKSRRPRRRPDLIIESIKQYRFEQDGEVLVLVVYVENPGNIRAGPTEVAILEPGYDWARERTEVGALNTGERREVELRLRLPNEVRGTTQTFLLKVDPGERIDELSEENNELRTRGIRTQPPSRKPPDLKIEFKERRFEENNEVLVLVVYVENLGNTRAGPTEVAILEPGYDWARQRTEVGALNPGERREVELRLRLPNEVRGTTQTFLLKVDPEERIDELEESNNELRRQVVLPIQTGPAPKPAEAEEISPEVVTWKLILFAVVSGSITLSAIIFTMHNTIRNRRRKKWQEKAKEKEPPERCRPCTYYCRKIEVELKPRRRKTTHLILISYDPVSGKQSKAQHVKGKFVDGLNRMITAHRRKKKPKKLMKQADTLSHTLLRQIIKSLQSEKTSRDVSVTAHLEGGQVTCQFILYHCKRKGTVTFWQEKDRWKKSFRDERDVSIGTLRGLDPAEPEMPDQLAPELSRFLTQFIEKV